MRAKWGQNFLVNTGTMRKIVDALEIPPEAPVLEIGPGRGALTQGLVERTRDLTVVELDVVLADRLARSFPQIRVVRADFLEWPLPEEAPGRYLVIGNLPYSAGGAILRKLMDWNGWSRAVVMVQKEVARRMVAGAGSRAYGVLSLAIGAKAEGRCLFDVPPGAFRPAPQVTSTVVALTRRAVPRVPPSEEPVFFRVVRAAFQQRRKNVLNALAHGLALDKPRVAEALETLGVNPGLRAENLDLDVYRGLAQRLSPVLAPMDPEN